MSLVQCEICPNYCTLPENVRGNCGIRINLKGDIYTLTYGKPCAVHVDPIEKKPAFHFLPGSGSFSIATAGCCLSCKYCQNWQISQSLPEDASCYDMPPEKVVEGAIRSGCKSIAYTYTEPTIFYEYMLDTARIAHEQGVGNVYVTCGFINQEPLEELTPVLDVANVDLKGFTEEFYRKVTGGRLKPVLNTIQYLYTHGVIVEITNLIVPTLNDNLKEIREMCEWVRDEVSPDVPMHFSRFHPQYKLKHLPPTPFGILKEARDVAREVGLKYVYIGNVVEPEGQNTICPQCKKTIVKRRGYVVSDMHITNNACAFCGEKIYGTWS